MLQAAQATGININDQILHLLACRPVINTPQLLNAADIISCSARRNPPGLRSNIPSAQFSTILTENECAFEDFDARDDMAPRSLRNATVHIR